MPTGGDRGVAPLVLMPVSQARAVLGVSANALKDRVRSGSLRGWPPGEGPNRTKRWQFAWDDVDRLANEKGLPCPAPGEREAGGSVPHRLRAENEDLRVGLELARESADVARRDLTRAESEALRAEVDRLRRENAALRAAVRQLAAPELDA